MAAFVPLASEPRECYTSVGTPPLSLLCCDAREGIVVSVDREGRFQNWVEVQWEDGDQGHCSRHHLERA